MKTYQVKMPDGKTYPVTGEEGATDEELRAAVMAEHRTAGIPFNPKDYAPTMPSAAEGMGPYERFSAGINAGLAEKKLGHQQAYDAITGGKNKTALDAEAKEANRLNRDLLDSGNIARGGNLVGNMMVDIPEMLTGSKLLQAGGKLLPQFLRTAAQNAPGVVKATGSAAKNFGGGAFAGTTTPSENYDFVRQAIQGGASAIPGTIGGWAAKRAVNPLGMHPPQGGSDLANRLAQFDEMPGVLAENRVNRDISHIPGATNTLAQMLVGGGGVKENRAKLARARTADQARTAGVESETLGPKYGAAVDKRVTEQWDKLRTFPDIPLHEMPVHLQEALEAVRRNPDLVGTKTAATSALERAIEETSAKGAGAASTRTPSIFATLDETAAAQPGHVGEPTLRQIIEQASSDLPGGRGRAPGPPIVPTELWGETGPTTLAGNEAKRPFRSGSSTVEGMQPGFTEPGHPTGGPFTGSTRFHIPEEPPAPKLPTMTAAEALQQHSEISRRLRDASVTAPDADKRMLYRSLLKSLDEQMEKAWGSSRWNEYQKVRLEEGAQRDMEKMKHRGGDTPSPQVVMDVMEDNNPGVNLNPVTPLEKRSEALNVQAPEPPLTENRSGTTRVLVGNPGAVTGGGMLASGGVTGALGAAFGADPLISGVAGGIGVPAASLALSHFLLGTEGGGRYLTGQNRSRVGRIAQSPEFADFLERAGLSTANTLGQKYLDDSKEFPYY
jgi:hypothetical protein